MMSKSWPIAKKRHHSFTLPDAFAKFSNRKKSSKLRGSSKKASASESTPSEVPGPSRARSEPVSPSSTRTKRKRPSETDLDCPQEETRTASPARKRTCKMNNTCTPKDDETAVKSESYDIGRKIRPTLKALIKTIQMRENSEFGQVTQSCPELSDIEWMHEDQEHEEEVAGELGFFTKYEMMSQRGEGGFAQVFSGERVADKLPVAIKVIPKKYVLFVQEVVDGAEVSMPLEAYLLYQVGAGCNSTSCSITPLLLDWYEIEDNIVLVIERPEPCLDLLDYAYHYHDNDMDHATVKKIFRQLVEEAIEMDAKGVFHRDIKPENILIEGDEVFSRARFIDFGCGTPFSPGDTFRQPQGTPKYASPEWYRSESYSPGPTTVWQLGLVLFYMLNNRLPLKSEESIGSFRQVHIPTRFHPDIRSLLKGCLDKNPKRRITLNELINHPWLKLPSDQPTQVETVINMSRFEYLSSSGGKTQH